MDKPSFLKKYKFNDFPSKCYLKTRLNSPVLVIGYSSDTQVAMVWLLSMSEEEIFYSRFPCEYIEASIAEIENAYKLFIQHRNLVRPEPEQEVAETPVIPSPLINLIDEATEQALDWHTDEIPPGWRNYYSDMSGADLPSHFRWYFSSDGSLVEGIDG